MDTSIYENKMEYPARPKKPILSREHTSEDAELYAASLKTWEKDMETYQESMKEYRAETHRLMDKFRHDALDDVGLLNHPKADKIYSKAWEDGHSSGLYSVYQELCDLAELFLD